MREPAISPIVWDPMCTPARYAAVVQRLLRVIAVKAVENVWLVAEAAQNKKRLCIKNVFTQEKRVAGNLTTRFYCQKLLLTR